MARYPSAEWAPVAWMNNLRHTRKTQLTVHITAGESDPRTIATWRNGQAGANFVIFRDGRTIQLADSACKSAADAGATHTISVECVGRDGPLTDAQVQALIRLARDAHRLDGVPLRLAATSSDAGIGWHRLGVDGNFPKGRMGGRLQRTPIGVKTSKARGKACPTDSVINQIYDVIVPALRGGTVTQEDDMPEPRDLWGYKNTAINGDLDAYQMLTDINESVRVIHANMRVHRGGKTLSLAQEVADAKTLALKAEGENAGLRAAIEALAKGQALSADQIQDAARKGAEEALKDGVKVTIDIPQED